MKDAFQNIKRVYFHVPKHHTQIDLYQAPRITENLNVISWRTTSGPEPSQIPELCSVLVKFARVTPPNLPVVYFYKAADSTLTYTCKVLSQDMIICDLREKNRRQMNIIFMLFRNYSLSFV
jgi:hypothetical protein